MNIALEELWEACPSAGSIAAVVAPSSRDLNLELLRIADSDSGLVLVGERTLPASTPRLLRANEGRLVEVRFPIPVMHPFSLLLEWEKDGDLVLFVGGNLAGVWRVDGWLPPPAALVRPSAPLLDLKFWPHLLNFRQRVDLLSQEGFSRPTTPLLYPIFKYRHPLFRRDARRLNWRDPSNIIVVQDRRYVYFTGVTENNGFKGDIYASHCAVQDDPSVPTSWSPPALVLSKGASTDHDGTGAFTPECHFDGLHIFLFYTGLHSTHEKGFPSWPVPPEPEHILVACSRHPLGPFGKTHIRTPLVSQSRSLGYHEATVPGGHVEEDGRTLHDVGLVDHGQWWIMPNGERRYYYKGGLGDGRHGLRGAVCVVRHLDENWKNGRRWESNPIISDSQHRHLEGILITCAKGVMYLQMQIFDAANLLLWETWTSDADDGLHWVFAGGGHRPLPGDNYPLSIGVDDVKNPRFAIGQQRVPDGVELAFYDVL